jgi:hypothetical protein
MNAEALNQSKFLQLFGMVLVYAKIKGILVKCSGSRSFIRDAEMQFALYQIGRRGIVGEATVTDCDGTHRKSLHQSGCAMDITVIDENGETIFDEKPYRILADFWKEIGGIWGGDFTSPCEIWHYAIQL